MDRPLVVKDLGRQDYQAVWQQMKAFTESRSNDTSDEIWFVEHDPVFTLGQAGKEEHLLAPGDIPVVRTDRGGQVTYHGPGQIVCYLLLDLKRLKLGVRQLVTLIEQSLILLLDSAGVTASSRREAPGVYVDGKKVASLGLRIRKGCSYHGLSLNVDMDLAPFRLINPCGYEGLEVTDLRHLGSHLDSSQLSLALADILARQIGYDGAPEIRVS